MNICVQVFVWTYAYIPLCNYLEVGRLEYMVGVHLAF